MRSVRLCSSLVKLRRAAWAIGLATVFSSAFPACKGRFTLPADARFVTQIALGDAFGCSRMKDGSVRCWGANDAGQLGDGTRAARAESVRVTLPGAASLLSVGAAEGCAMAPDLHCWGGAAVDGKGDGALRGGAKELALGTRHTCALSGTGDVTCWGAVDPGQLGGSEPGALIVRGATAIAAGGDATCAILRDRAVVCWGTLPVRGTLRVTQIEGLADVTQVAMSATHVCATRAWGGVACFGRDEEVELGDGAFSARPNAVVVVGLTVPARAFSVCRAHSFALLRDGSVHCWGANGRAQLADGTTAHRPSPVQVNGVFEVEEVVAAADATCTRFLDGSERCWGGLSLPKTLGATIPVPTEVRW